MNKHRAIKSVMLLVCIGIIVVSSVEPIAGQTGEHSTNGNDHAQMFAEAKRIIDTHVSCDKLTDDQFEALGEYYMEQMHPGEAHERMDRMMSNMMGEEGLRQMHINMGRMMYCGMGGGMMGGGMMGGYTANVSAVQPISGNQTTTPFITANETVLMPVTMGNQTVMMPFIMIPTTIGNQTVMTSFMMMPITIENQTMAPFTIVNQTMALPFMIGNQTMMMPFIKENQTIAPVMIGNQTIMPVMMGD